MPARKPSPRKGRKNVPLPLPLDQGKRVSLRDIAKVIGVTPTTVSLAMRDRREISAELRQQIQAKARELGYRPDPMLAALAHYRRGSTKRPITAGLAWINCWPEPQRLRTFKEFELYWQGAAKEAARAGYHLEEFCCPKELSPERLAQILHARNVRGLLLTPMWADVAPDWGNFPWDDFGVVRFGFSLQTPRAHVVATDQLMDGMLAFDSMLNLGYRRIGMAMRSQGTRAVRFSAGYLYAQLRVSAELRLPPMILSEPEAEKAQLRLTEWLEKEKPDAILTDITAMPDMLAKAGYRVPQDVGLAALSVLDGHADAGINQNSEEVGKVAVQLLISLINHNEPGVPAICRELLVEGHWVDGHTLPPKKLKR